MYPIINRTWMITVGWDSMMIRTMTDIGIHAHSATPSTITGRAASTDRTRITTAMMTAMTDFGVKGNSDRKDFRISDFSYFRMHRYSVIQLFSCFLRWVNR